MPPAAMRGAWLVLCACSLARADLETPLPAEPELNARWLEGFRRDLLRDAYDYEVDPKLSPSPLSMGKPSTAGRVYFTRTLEIVSNFTPQGAPDRTSDKQWSPARDASVAPLVGHPSSRPSARRASDAASAGHMAGRPLARYAVRRASDRSLPPLDKPDALSVGHRSNRISSARDATSGRASLDAPDAHSVEHLSGKPPVRLHPLPLSDEMGPPPHTPDGPSVGRVPGATPARAPEDAASHELGISRRDLYGGRGHGSITDGELDAKRQPFLDKLSELDEQMRPVIIRRDQKKAGYRYTDSGNIPVKSRKRFWDEHSEQDKPSYIIDQNGIQRYKVHTDRRERFRNQFGRDQPWFKEEWGIGDVDEMLHAPNEYKYRARASDENLAQNEDDQEQESRDASSAQESRDSVSGELDVSEYRQENVRSRYVQGARPGRGRGRGQGQGGGGDYAQRFSARRDAALLADGLAFSTTPCNCTTDDPRIVPEL